MNTVQVKMALITMKTKVGNQNFLIKYLVNPSAGAIQGPITPFWDEVFFPRYGAHSGRSRSAVR